MANNEVYRRRNIHCHDIVILKIARKHKVGWHSYRYEVRVDGKPIAMQTVNGIEKQSGSQTDAKRLFDLVCRKV